MYMKTKEKHKWIEVPLKDTGLSVIKREKCIRGECNCERTTYFMMGLTGYMYSRDGQVYSLAPECHGDIPLNDQTID